MKIIKYSILVLLVILFTLVCIPYFFKDKIVELIKQQVNTQLLAKVNFNEDVSLSLLKDFPSMSLKIEDLSVVGANDFDGDTLFSSQSFSVSLDIMSVINGAEIIVKKISLDKPRIKALVLKDGKANWDITKIDSSRSNAVSDTVGSAFNLKLKSLELNDAYIYYNDEASHIVSELEHFNYTLSGDFSEKLFEMKNSLEITSLTVGMDGVNYLNKVRCSANASIDADLNLFLFTFKDNEFSLNDLHVAFAGKFAMPKEDMNIDITYSVKQNDFKNFLSLIPALYANDFQDLQAKGNLKFSGHVKGVYNEKQMPSFGLQIGIENGWFKYASLPVPFQNTELDLVIQNPDGIPDHTVIELNKLHFEIEKDPFDAKLLVKTPVSDPYMEAMVKGLIDLNKISKLVPLEKTSLSGMIRSDWNLKGSLSALEKGDYNNFTASGNLICEQIRYASPDYPKPFQLIMANFGLSPQSITLKEFDAKIDGNDMRMEGEISNYLAYYFEKGPLKGRLNFNSTLFNANTFMSESTTDTNNVKTDSAQMTVIEIPSNIEFTLHSNIDKLLYSNLEIQRFIGNIEIKEQQLNFQNIALQLLGSNMKMKGFYETKNPKKPSVDIDFSIVNLDIQQAFKTFNTVQKLAPAAEHVFGLFDANLKIQTQLRENMQPNLDVLYLAGNLAIPYAEIKEIKAINMLTDLIQKPEYKSISMNNTAIAFIVEKGRVNTKPFDIKLGKQNMKLSGSTGLDQTIDYVGNIDIPRKDLGASNQAMSDALAKINSQAGSDIKMNETLPLQVKIGGTFGAPTLNTNLTDLAKNELNSLTGQLKDETLRMKQEAIDKAKAEAEKIKNEGIRMKNEAEAKLRAETDRIRKEAEVKAKAESERIKREAEMRAREESAKLKKQAEEEAKKRLKGLLK